jgi:hypothetical protein
MRTNERFDALLRATADVQDEVRADIAPQQRARVRSALLERAQAPQRLRWPIVAVPVAAIVAVVIALFVVRTDTALSFEHGPGRRSGVVGAWLAAPAERAEVLVFSDGSAIDLHPRTRARVTSLETTEASVVLEAGTADVRIESGRSRRWQIHGGPYRVEVTGTRFALAWDPARESFDLELHEGSVLVTGPGIDGAERVSAGESLHVGGEDPPAEQVAAALPVRIDEQPSASGSPATPTSGADDPPAQPEAETVADTPDVGAATRRSRARRPLDPAAAPDPVDSRDAWRGLASTGSYRDALVAAEDYGFAALCESLPARDLLQLADVGRFARKPQRAIEALRAVRRRFPDGDAAAMAAFERGRIANASPAAYPEAAKWFATYLREQPDGPLVREALARLMEAQTGAGQDAAARKTAARYVEKFPGGPHRDLADTLLSGAGP